MGHDAAIGTGAGKPRSLKQRAIEEFRLFVILFLYLWALLGLFVLNEDVVSRKEGASIAFQGFAILNALVLAKVMLVAEHLELARWLSGRPLVLTIVFEAVLCTVIFAVVHVLERVAVGLFHGEALSASMPSFGGGGLAGVAIVSLIVAVSLLPFFTFKNLARAIGPERMTQILFRGSNATP